MTSPCLLRLTGSYRLNNLFEALLQKFEFPYFCTMRSLPVYCKRLTALLLLGLFVFIQAEKSLHGHSNVSKLVHEGTRLSHTNFNCPLCDFQLAANADLPDNSFYLAPVYFASVQAQYNNPVYYSSDRYSFDLRGPPSYC